MPNVAFDNAASVRDSGANPTSVSITVSLANSIVIAAFNAPSSTLGSPTLAGVAPSGTIGTQSGSFKFVYWLGVSAGTKSLSCGVTFGGGASAGITAVAYGGVNQITFPDAGPNNSSGADVSVTSVAQRCWAIYFATKDNFGNNPTSTDTSRITGGANTGGAEQQFAFFDSNASIGAAGSSFSSHMTSSWTGQSVIIMTLAPLFMANTSTPSDSMMNAVSRLATVISVKGKIAAMADSMMNAVSRLATTVRVFSSIRRMSDAIMNSASRFVVATRTVTYIRSVTDSIMNAVARFVGLSTSETATWKPVSRPTTKWTPIGKGQIEQ